jgi:hypothetical protein
MAKYSGQVHLGIFFSLYLQRQQQHTIHTETVEAAAISLPVHKRVPERYHDDIQTT